MEFHELENPEKHPIMRKLPHYDIAFTYAKKVIKTLIDNDKSVPIEEKPINGYAVWGLKWEKHPFIMDKTDNFNETSLKVSPSFIISKSDRLGTSDSNEYVYMGQWVDGKFIQTKNPSAFLVSFVSAMESLQVEVPEEWKKIALTQERVKNGNIKALSSVDQPPTYQELQKKITILEKERSEFAEKLHACETLRQQSVVKTVFDNPTSFDAEKIQQLKNTLPSVSDDIKEDPVSVVIAHTIFSHINEDSKVIDRNNAVRDLTKVFRGNVFVPLSTNSEKIKILMENEDVTNLIPQDLKNDKFAVVIANEIRKNVFKERDNVSLSNEEILSSVRDLTKLIKSEVFGNEKTPQVEKAHQSEFRPTAEDFLMGMSKEHQSAVAKLQSMDRILRKALNEKQPDAKAILMTLHGNSWPEMSLLEEASRIVTENKSKKS